MTIKLNVPKIIAWMASEGFVLFQRGILSSAVVDAQDTTGLWVYLEEFTFLAMISNGQTEMSWMKHWKYTSKIG